MLLLIGLMYCLFYFQMNPRHKKLAALMLRQFNRSLQPLKIDFETCSSKLIARSIFLKLNYQNYHLLDEDNCVSRKQTRIADRPPNVARSN